MASALCVMGVYVLFSRGTQSPDTIARLCDAIRVELERIDLVKYVNSILTAYVVKTPPEYEAALSVLLRLGGKILTVFAFSYERLKGSSTHRKRQKCGGRCCQICHLLGGCRSAL